MNMNYEDKELTFHIFVNKKKKLKYKIEKTDLPF